MKEKITKMM